MAGQAQPDGFRFLYVCTGNICRSPFAELLTAHLLVERLGPDVRRFKLGSAGTRAVVGSAMHPQTRKELAPWGLDGDYAGRFTARQLQGPMLAAADLVLTAAPEHRAAALALHPQAIGYTFTLREFARLAAAVDPAALPVAPLERAHALVGRARALRGKIRAAKPDDDAVIDPIGRSSKTHREAAGMITDAAREVIEAIVL